MEKRWLDNWVFWLTIGLVFSVILLAFGVHTIILRRTPPDKAAVQERLNTDYDELCIVTEFLLDLKNPSVLIDKPDGTMLIAYDYEKIEDEQVVKTVKNLLDTKKYKRIYVTGNTVYFVQWQGIGGDEVGVAYAPNGRSTVQAEFLTEVAALEKQNWFYCVCDYEEWRTRQP